MRQQNRALTSRINPCDRPSGAAPKPNTRFLRQIIRQTDNHNASLKQKEEREARDRMRQLRDHTRPASSSTSHRHRTSDDRGAQRDRESREDRERRHRSHRRRHRSRSKSPEEERSRRHRQRHDSRRDRRDRDEDGRGYSRRSRSPRDERRHGSRNRRHKRSSRYSRSPSRSRSHTPEPSKRPRHTGHDDDDDRTHNHSERLQGPCPPAENDSDPLEDLVGPLPAKEAGNEPIRSRGRGAYKPNTSTIDSHFAKDYDPTLDIHPDEDNNPQSRHRSTRRPVQGLMTEGDDWELSLEALRDRARWKQKGEERLRQAGFDESTLERWRSNAAFTAGGGGGDSEGRVEDVKWSKRGEGREWDRGKVLDEEGHVDVKALW